MASSTPELIKTAVNHFLEEVPALAKLKLVFELELQGRGDVQMFRVELPGPQIAKTVADDARIRVMMPRADFNELAEKGTIKGYHDAYDVGHIKVEGDDQIIKLLAQVIGKREERDHLRKAH